MLRKMNYTSDQQGIMKRFVQEYDSWKQHIDNTKNEIIRWSQNKSKTSCAILGSGWLIDVPLAELSQIFKKVVLYDILHPNPIKNKIKQYSNVEMIELDVTGNAVQECYNAIQYYKGTKKVFPLNDIQISGFPYSNEFDYVVSVNILNQLDILLVDYLKNYNLYPDQAIHEFRTKIQATHLNSLPKDKSCLITDTEEKIFTPEGSPEIVNSLIHIDLPKQKLVNSWDWKFDMHQNYIRGKNVIFKVESYSL